MRKIFTLISAVIFVISSINVNAQSKDSLMINNSEFKTIFNSSKDKPSVSGFGAINMDLGLTSGNTNFNLGLDFAVLINKSLYFGLYERTLVSFPEYNFEYYNADTNMNISTTTRGFFIHGGIIIGGVFFPNKPIHFGLSTKIGGGAFGMFETEEHLYENKKSQYYNDNKWGMAPLMVITPQIDLEMNINYWFKFRISAGYQWVSNSSLTYKKLINGQIKEQTLISASDLSNPYISIGLIFGWFK